MLVSPAFSWTAATHLELSATTLRRIFAASYRSHETSAFPCDHDAGSAFCNHGRAIQHGKCGSARVGVAFTPISAARVDSRARVALEHHSRRAPDARWLLVDCHRRRRGTL